MGLSECGNVDGNRFPCQKRCGEKSPLKGSKIKINHGDPFRSVLKYPKRDGLLIAFQGMDAGRLSDEFQ